MHKNYIFTAGLLALTYSYSATALGPHDGGVPDANLEGSTDCNDYNPGSGSATCVYLQNHTDGPLTIKMKQTKSGGEHGEEWKYRYVGDSDGAVIVEGDSLPMFIVDDHQDVWEYYDARFDIDILLAGEEHYVGTIRVDVDAGDANQFVQGIGYRVDAGGSYRETAWGDNWNEVYDTKYLTIPSANGSTLLEDLVVHAHKPQWNDSIFYTITDRDNRRGLHDRMPLNYLFTPQAHNAYDYDYISSLWSALGTTRMLELDVWFYEGSEDIEVAHIFGEALTSCDADNYTYLEDCLNVVKDSLQKHESLPAIVRIEPKTGLTHGHYIKGSDSIGRFASIMYTPEDLLTSAGCIADGKTTCTLQGAIKKAGWPKLEEVNNKLIILLSDTSFDADSDDLDDVVDALKVGSPVSKLPLVFPRGDIDKDDSCSIDDYDDSAIFFGADWSCTDNSNLKNHLATYFIDSAPDKDDYDPSITQYNQAFARNVNAVKTHYINAGPWYADMIKHLSGWKGFPAYSISTDNLDNGDGSYSIYGNESDSLTGVLRDSNSATGVAIDADHWRIDVDFGLNPGQTRYVDAVYIRSEDSSQSYFFFCERDDEIELTLIPANNTTGVSKQCESAWISHAVQITGKNSSINLGANPRIHAIGIYL